MNLKNEIRTVPDWPKKGIMFRDITTLLNNPEAFKQACDNFYEHYKNKNITSVVGIESRGFIFGSVLAYKLGVGFIPIRKPEKLPSETISQSYELEYGSDTIEIHKDSIKKGDNILLIDDLIATGGTAEAAIKLIRKLGGNVVEFAFLIDLLDLKGKEKLDCPIFTIMKFEGD